MSSAEGSVKVIVIAFLANMGIAVAKFVGAFLSQSTALLAEAIHSVVDSTNQVLLLIGSKRSKKSPTLKHPMGYGREAFFWSFLVAILLFSLGGIFAIYEGVHKLHASGELSAPYIALGILLASLGLETFSFLTCIKEVKAQNTFGSLWKWFRHTTASELLIIFTEDLAALLGLLLATASLLLSWLTGNLIWDAIGSILVGVVLVIVAIALAIEIKSLIIGEATATDLRPFLKKRIAELFPEGKLLRLLALQIGSDEIMVSYKIHPGGMSDVKQLIDTINQLEQEVRQQFPAVRWQFVEPDYEA
jgi:cation diffusion facilitator family transporter